MQFPTLKKSVLDRLSIKQCLFMLKASSAKCWLIEKIREKELSAIPGFSHSRSELGLFHSSQHLHLIYRIANPTFSLFSHLLRASVPFLTPPFFFLLSYLLLARTSYFSLWSLWVQNSLGRRLHHLCNCPRQTNFFILSWLRSFSCSLLRILCSPLCSKGNVSPALTMLRWADGEIRHCMFCS